MSFKIVDLFSVSGKVALVTGGSRGIGEMIARGLVENGARVYISSRKADVCDAIAAELSQNGTCVSLPADLSQMSEIERVANELAARESKLDILVNNAGAVWGETFDRFSEKGWDRVMDLNVKSLFFLTQKLGPLLFKAGSADDPARVINIGSIDGLQAPVFENYSYSASKAAVHQLTMHLARHLAGRHVAVNAIAPGFFPSQMTAFMDENLDQVLPQIPLHRVGTPEDMAGTVLFLASRAGAYLCGSVVKVDGGLLVGGRHA
jgi:NAD(P)-dependent dehydrogenase (short-subunit alcohol dehydrogenase family)